MWEMKPYLNNPFCLQSVHFPRSEAENVTIHRRVVGSEVSATVRDCSWRLAQAWHNADHESDALRHAFIWYAGNHVACLEVLVGGDIRNAHHGTRRHARFVQNGLCLDEWMGTNPGADDLVEFVVMIDTRAVVAEAFIFDQSWASQRLCEAAKHILAIAADCQPVSICRLVYIRWGRTQHAVARALAHNPGMLVLGEHGLGLRENRLGNGDIHHLALPVSFAGAQCQHRPVGRLLGSQPIA